MNLPPVYGKYIKHISYKNLNQSKQLMTYFVV